MTNHFTSKLQSWLNNDQRTIEDGCLLLLQMENNQIHYQNLLRHPNKPAVMKYLTSELQKRLTVRLANITHEEVAAMDEQAKVIVKEHFAYQDAANSTTSSEEFRRGKRADHDQLPDDIQALYVENLDLLRRMRELHLKLRSLSTEQPSCPDSERYPFLKELITLDKRLHANWDTYDHFTLTANAAADATADATSPSAARSVSGDSVAAPATAPASVHSPSPSKPKKSKNSTSQH